MTLIERHTGNLGYWGLALALFAIGTMPAVAQNPAIRVDNNGDVGFGTNTPDDGDTLAERFIEVKDANDARVVVDSGDGPGRFGEFMFQRGNSNTWSFGNENSRFYIFNYDRNAYDISINRATGNVILSGTCTDGGGAGGCDGVFESDYNLPSIEEHAASMWANKHLPAIGPTPDGDRISFSLQQRHFGVLNELEKAHIYIEQLHKRVKDLRGSLESERARNDELEQRLARLENVMLVLTAEN